MPAYAPNLDSATPLPRGARPWQITASVAERAEQDARRNLYALRACVRTVTANDRTRECGHRAVRTEGPAIEVTYRADGAKAKWLGALMCGRRWTCPVCASKILAKRRVQIVDALSEGRAREPTRAWTMLTLSIRHRIGMPLAELLRGLRKAWRRTRQRGSCQRIWKAHVVASVRAVEVTDGKHGWHPHLHVLVLSDPWTDDERETVASTWREMVTRELGVECSPDAAHGAHWSRASVDGYLAKLGLEATGAAKKNGPWSHAEAAGERYAVARRMHSRDERARVYEQGDRRRARFREYEAATKGCRAIELDDRAQALAQAGEQTRISGGPTQKDDDAAPAPSCEVDMTAIVETQLGPMSMMRALRVLERSGDRCVFSTVLEVAARAPPGTTGAALRGWLDERIAIRFAAWRHE